MPLYRGERYVAAAIESVLAQTYTPFELIVVNDGSPDASVERISRYLQNPQVRYIEQENAGVAAARNTGLAHARGELIALLDQDDLWLPTKLKRQVAYLEAHPDVGMVHSQVDCVDATGRTCSCSGAIWVYPFEGSCAGRLLLGNGIAPLTVLVRRQCIDEVGMFEQKFAPADDWELWIRIARRYPLGFIDEVTARYRVHEENASKDHVKMQQTVLAIIDSICERFPDVPGSVAPAELARARCRALSWIAEALERDRRRSEAKAYWKEAYGTNGDLIALLALLGMPMERRRRVEDALQGLPRLRRILAWYSYRFSTRFPARARHRSNG